MSRLEDNHKLLNSLEYLINKHPDMRFSQILHNFGFIKPNRPAKPESRIDWQDEFYVEPDVILERVKRRIKDNEE